MRAEMRATAQARGRDGQLAEAMVDRKVVIEDVVDDQTLLTVSTQEALELGLAERTSKSLQDLLSAVGADTSQVIQVAPNWAETVSRWLTDPTFAGILMSLGMLGLMVEVYSPGIGFAGALGVLCLGAFFGGHMVADLAGVEELALLIIGLGMLVIEALVIPGFGIFGILGLVSIAMAFTMSLVGMPLGLSWDLGLFSEAFTQVSWSLLGTFVALIAIISLMPQRNILPSFLVLKTRLGEGTSSADPLNTTFKSSPDQSELVGSRGTAETDLRPAGKVRIDQRIIDVVSEHAWISKGESIVVVHVEGVRVVVQKNSDPA
jgi:membrane-bound serine protease (ClpP class)